MVAPAPATNMPKTSSSQFTVAMLSQGRGVGEGAFQRALGAHGSAAGFLAAWLRHPRKNRSRSSATPARLSLLGGQLRMLMRRGNVSIVAMHKRSMLTCHDQQAGSPRLQTGMLTSSHWLPRQRRRGHLAVLSAPQCRKRRAARGTRRPGRSAGLQVACNGGDWLSSGALPDTVLFHTGITCTEREAASTPSANAARGKKQEEHGMHVLIKHGVRWLIL